MTQCHCCSIREVGGFSCFPDYDHHKRRVTDSDNFELITVAQRYGGIGGLDESWVRCKRCGQVWRVVEPDPPFKGMWAEVTE